MPRPGGKNLPAIIAHRGTPTLHPENTIPGFRQAAALGADAIELDVHQTRDGVVVVRHDPTLGTGSNSPLRRINDMTYAETQGYPVAPHVTIPTLLEALGAVPDRITVYVEIKAQGIEQQVVADIARAGARHRSAVHSFDHRVARRVAELDPDLPTGILLASYLVDPVHTLHAAGARDYWAQHDFIDAPLVDGIHAAGGRVIAWTVNERGAAARLTEIGVDGICTDVCGEFRSP